MSRKTDLLSVVQNAGTEGVDQIAISRKITTTAKHKFKGDGNLNFTPQDKALMAELVTSGDVDAILNETGRVVRWIDPAVRF